MGLPGSGKTTLAKRLSKLIGALHINADEARASLNSDLGFSIEDRIENARRLGAVAKLIKGNGHSVVTDFVCPTKETRDMFDADLVIWMNTIKSGRFDDTNKIFVPPEVVDIEITNLKYSVWQIKDQIISLTEIKHPVKG